MWPSSLPGAQVAFPAQVMVRAALEHHCCVQGSDVLQLNLPHSHSVGQAGMDDRWGN